MSRFYRNFELSANGQTTVRSMLIDTGADITIISQDTACLLGFVPNKTARMSIRYSEPSPKQDAHVDKIVTRTLGFAFNNLWIKGPNGKGAFIKAFVGDTEIYYDENDKELDREPAPSDEEELIGHDWLQATESILDFKKNDHQLRGSTAKRMTVARATPYERGILARSKLCRR